MLCRAPPAHVVSARGDLCPPVWGWPPFLVPGRKEDKRRLGFALRHGLGEGKNAGLGVGQSWFGSRLYSGWRRFGDCLWASASCSVTWSRGRPPPRALLGIAGVILPVRAHGFVRTAWQAYVKTCSFPFLPKAVAKTRKSGLRVSLRHGASVPRPRGQRGSQSSAPGPPRGSCTRPGRVSSGPGVAFQCESFN